MRYEYVLVLVHSEFRCIALTKQRLLHASLARTPPARLARPLGPLRKNHNAIARAAGVERSATTLNTQPVYIQMCWYPHAVHHDGLRVSGNWFLFARLSGSLRARCLHWDKSYHWIVIIQWCELSLGVFSFGSLFHIIWIKFPLLGRLEDFS